MFTQLIVSGILLGGVYALLSIGLSLILGVSKFVNFAHGDFVMIGAYMSFIFYIRCGLFPYYSWPLVILCAMIFGAIIFLVAKHTIGKKAENQMLLTLGLSMILQNSMLMIFRSDYKGVPSQFGSSINIGSAFFSQEQIIIFVIAITTTIAFLIFIQYSNIGRAMRAVGENRNTSKLMGINVKKVDLIVFLLGTIMACFAGALLITIYPTTPTIGSAYNILAWIMVILGGVGHLYGAFFAGFIIGVTETLTGFYLGADLRQLVYFILFVIILVICPEGLFSRFSFRKVKRE